jgi:Fic family protein
MLAMLAEYNTEKSGASLFEAGDLRENDFSERAPGRLVKGSGPSGEYWAFVPEPLPRHLELPAETVGLLTEASMALGELNGVGRMLPNPDLLIGSFLRREAVSSSRIEGIETNFEQLLLFEVESGVGEVDSDRQEVVNYIEALRYGLERLKTLPVSLRLIRETHEKLLRGVRGEQYKPGEFRDRQNMIGRSGQAPADARFVPPPVAPMKEALNDLEKYMAYPPGMPVLVELALIHYQFETIHPFLDGNGRMGRLLLSLLLCERGCLNSPLLYLSAYFERHKQAYVDHLLTVSRSGDWLGWIDFFLKGVAVQSSMAVDKAAELLNLWREYREMIQVRYNSSNMLKLIDRLFDRPAISIRQAALVEGVTFAAAQRHVDRLEQDGILKEVTGRTKNRVYVAERIVEIIARQEGDPVE